MTLGWLISMGPRVFSSWTVLHPSEQCWKVKSEETYVKDLPGGTVSADVCKTATLIFFWSEMNACPCGRGLLHHALRPKSTHVQDSAMWLLSFLPESSGINCKRCKSDSPTSGLLGTLSVRSAQGPYPTPPHPCRVVGQVVETQSVTIPAKQGACWEVPGSFSPSRSGFMALFCFSPSIQGGE